MIPKYEDRLTPKQCQLLNDLLALRFVDLWADKRTNLASKSPAELKSWATDYEILVELARKLHRHYGSLRPCVLERMAQSGTTLSTEEELNV